MPDLRTESALGLKRRLSLETLHSTGSNTGLLHLNTFLFLLKDDLFPTRSAARSPAAGLSFFLSYLTCVVSATLEPNFQLDYKY